VQTRKPEEAINITPEVEAVVRKTGVKQGLVNVMTSHTSSGLLVTEGIPCLEEDILTHFSRLFPDDENYHHHRYLDYDGRLGFNAETHLKAYWAASVVLSHRRRQNCPRFAPDDLFHGIRWALLRTYMVQVIGE